MTITRHLVEETSLAVRGGPTAAATGIALIVTSLLSCESMAQNNQENKTVAMTRMTRARPEQRFVLADLMPADLPAIVVVPRVAALLRDLQTLNRLLSPLHPEWRGKGLVGAIVRRLEGGASLLPPSQQNIRRLRALTTEEGLVEAGIDPLGTLVIAPDFDLRVVLVAFELVDRPQFARWLIRMAGDARQSVKVSGEIATVVTPQGRMPVTCLGRRSYALCQLGVPADGDPIRSLRKLAALRGPRLGSPAGKAGVLHKAWDAMPAGAHVYAVGDTKKLAPRLGEMVTEWESAATRFAEPNRRRAALAHVAHLRKKLAAASKLTEGVAAGLYTRREGMELRSQVNLTNFGHQLLQWWLPPKKHGDVIARWTRTPALMRFVARVRPELLELAAISLGWSPPKDALTGDMGIIAVGLDGLCSAAKRAQDAPGDETYWGFIFPSALVVGLQSTDAADRVQASLGRIFKSEKKGNGARFPTVPPTSRPRLSKRIDGDKLDLQVLDRLLVFGMGPGILSAGVRRLGAIPPAGKSNRRAPPFLDVTLFPASIDAAFDAARIGPDHRPYLRRLEAWRLRWKPLLNRLRSMRLSARMDGLQRRLVLVGTVAE